MALGKLMANFRRKCVKITDRRVRMMNEILTCVKLIKMYAWEKSFAKAIGLYEEKFFYLMNIFQNMQRKSTTTFK